QEGAHDFDAFSHAIGERAHRGIGVLCEPGGRQLAARFLDPRIASHEPNRLDEVAPRGGTEVLADEQVLEHGEVAHQPDVLEIAGEAEADPVARAYAGNVVTIEQD